MVTGTTYRERIDPQELQLTESVVQIRRVAKVVKGGRHLSFTALVVVGDGQGHVGVGLGKALAVPDAVRKGTTIARGHLIQVSMKRRTIPYVCTSKYGAAELLLKPAAPGTGIIAGGGVRAVMELAGITDIVAKSLRSSNPVNLVRAAVQALASLEDPEDELARRLPKVAERRRVRRQALAADVSLQEPSALPPVLSSIETEDEEREN